MANVLPVAGLGHLECVTVAERTDPRFVAR
jgi:hypothetical protein